VRPSGCGGAGGRSAGGAGTGGTQNGQQQGQQDTAAGKGAAAAGTNGTTTDAGKGTRAIRRSSGSPPRSFPSCRKAGRSTRTPSSRSTSGSSTPSSRTTSCRPRGRCRRWSISRASSRRRPSRRSRRSSGRRTTASPAQPGRDLETLKADKDFGGPNYQATIDGAKRIEAFAFGEDLRKLLEPLRDAVGPRAAQGLRPPPARDLRGRDRHQHGPEQPDRWTRSRRCSRTRTKMRKNQGKRAP
jgi:hypothetical protein